MYILIGLILVVGVILIIPEKNNEPEKVEPIEEVDVTFTISETNMTLKVNETRSINYHLSSNYPISWYSSNNSVATVKDGNIKGISEGSTIITGTINANNKIKSISCNVTVIKEEKQEEKKDEKKQEEKKDEKDDKQKEDTINLEKVVIKNSNLNLTSGESKKIEYSLVPENATITSIKWDSSDISVATVNNGEVKALKEGSVTITLTINEIFIGKVNVKIVSKASDVVINNYPKLVIRIGEKTKVSASTNPSGGTINYQSSNNGVASIDSSGTITGVSEGKTTIRLSSGGKEKSIDITVLPKKGLINGTGDLWGYKSKNSKSHALAGVSFFQKLAASGKGSLNGNTYTLNNGNDYYRYYIDRSMLDANGKTVMVRIYYPTSGDLSTMNTLTYMGGDGEMNFNGIFGEIKNNPSMLDNSDGIVILVAEGNKTHFDQYVGYLSTNFVKAFVSQKSGVKNSIIGFSTGGTKVMGAANLSNYDRVIVFSSYYNWPTSANNVKNKEVMFYIPNGDHLYKQAKTTLNDMKKSGYTNVTIVTNSSELTNLFKNDFLVINVGGLMTNAHVTENVVKSGILSYANE